MHMLVT